MDAPDDTSPTLEDVYPKGPLFKFMSLADGQTPSWKKRFAQLIRGEAYLSSPRQFNDPFDCVVPVVLPATIEAFNAQKDQFYRRLERAMPDVPAETIRSVDNDIQAMGVDRFREITLASFEKGTARMGVFCLTEAVENVLMWSHYADHHRGIALRFSGPAAEGGGLDTFFRVRYQKRRPVITAYFSEDDGAKDIMDALCTKSVDWHYEREWRFLEPEAAGTVIPFDASIITGVILGERTTDADALWILDQCLQHGIPLMKAMMHSEKFEMVFHGAYDPETHKG